MEISRENVYWKLYIFSNIYSIVEPKRPRKHPVRLKPIDGAQKNGDIETFKQPKKDREHFRKALVEIIMYVDNFGFCCNMIETII